MALTDEEKKQALGGGTPPSQPAAAPAPAPAPNAAAVNPGGGATPAANTAAALQSSPSNATPSGTTGPQGNTTLGNVGINTKGGSTADKVGNAATSVLDPGGFFNGASTASLTPVQTAQAAAYGTAGGLANERAGYNPGAAPSQNGVNIDTTQSDQIRARQLGSLDKLSAAANGTVPSAADLQAKEAAGNASAATLGAARALGGRSAGGAAEAGSRAVADALATSDAAGAARRATEQANARDAEQTALTGARGQDITGATNQAQLTQAGASNNLTAQTQANALAEAHRKELLDSQIAAMGQGATAAGNEVQASEHNADAENKQKGGIIGTVGSWLGL